MPASVKIIFKVIATLSFAAAMACGGAAIEQHRALGLAKAHAHDVLSVIVVGACHRFLGVVVVSKDGTVNGTSHSTPEIAQAAASTLPEGNSAVIDTPCGGQTT